MRSPWRPWRSRLELREAKGFRLLRGLAISSRQPLLTSTSQVRRAGEPARPLQGVWAPVGSLP